MSSFILLTCIRLVGRAADFVCNGHAWRLQSGDQTGDQTVFQAANATLRSDPPWAGGVQRTHSCQGPCWVADLDLQPDQMRGHLWPCPAEQHQDQKQAVLIHTHTYIHAYTHKPPFWLNQASADVKDNMKFLLQPLGRSSKM